MMKMDGYEYGTCSLKRFAALISTSVKKARAFLAVIHFHPNPLFPGKARSLTLEWSLVRGSSRVGSTLTYKY